MTNALASLGHISIIVAIAATVCVEPLHGQRITGTLRETLSRMPVSAASIELSDSTGRLIADARTDTLGRYRIDARMPGAYSIRAAKIGYLSARGVLVRLDSAPVIVDLELPRGVRLDSVRVVDIAEPVRALQQLIRGRLIDEDTGGPLSNGTIELRKPSDEVVASATTDENGDFRIVSPTPGTYSLHGKRIGYHPAHQAELRLRLGDTLRVEFRLSRLVTLLAPVLITQSMSPWAGREESGRTAEFHRRLERFANLRHVQFFFRDSIAAWDERGETLGRMLDRRVKVGVPRGPGCSGARTFLEGFPDSDGAATPLHLIEFVEVYTHPSLPAEFMAPVVVPGQRSPMVPPCRVLSLWIRR